jgi:hypothetical protein
VYSKGYLNFSIITQTPFAHLFICKKGLLYLDEGA